LLGSALKKLFSFNVLTSLRLWPSDGKPVNGLVNCGGP
jgi:hypothetical protein